MKLESLRCLCAVIEGGSFRAAAVRLHKSQPAISQQIKLLEQQIGHTLIERKMCHATPAGKRLYERAKHLLADIDDIIREMGEFGDTWIPELRVGTSDTTALYVLPPIIHTFSEQVPQTHLVLINRPSSQIADLVRKGELDIGIVTFPMEGEELEKCDLFTQQLVLVVPENHPVVTRRFSSLASLREEPFLMLNQSTRTGHLLRRYFQKKRFKPQVVLDTGSFEVIKRYIAHGTGISILPDLVVSDEDRSLVKINIPDLPRIQIGAIWRRDTYQSKAQKAFLSLFAENYGTDCA